MGRKHGRTEGVRKIAARFGVAVGTANQPPFRGLRRIRQCRRKSQVLQLVAKTHQALCPVSVPAKRRTRAVTGSGLYPFGPRAPNFVPPSPPPGFSRVARSRVGSIAVRRSPPCQSRNDQGRAAQLSLTGNSSPLCVASTPCGGCVVARCLLGDSGRVDAITCSLSFALRLPTRLSS